MQIGNKLDNFLDLICSRIKYKPIRESISDEIKNHIEELKENYVLEGNSQEIAEEKAILNMGNAEEIGEKLNKIHRPKIDIKLLIIVFFMIAVGIIVTYSLSTSIYKNGLGSSEWFTKNIVVTLIGICIGTFIYFFDYTKMKKISGIIYIVATLSSVLICSFSSSLGYSIIENRGIVINDVSIPISIFNIIISLYIISFAGFICNFNLKKKNDILLLSILTIFSLYVVCTFDNMVYLVILLSSYFAIFMTGLFKTNLYSKKYKFITLSIFVIIALSIIDLFLITSSQYTKERLKAIVNPNGDYDYEYQMGYRRNILNNSKVIGSANIEGIFDKDITLKDYAYGLVNAEDEEMFSYIIGKYGTFVAAILIVCILFLAIKIIANAKNIKDLYGKYIIVGFATMIIIQSILNLLSNLCLIAPNSALLPFISCSYSENVFNIIILALILSIYRRKDILVLNKENV